MLEPRRRTREHVNRLAQQLLAGFAALDEAERAQRDADRARRAPPRDSSSSSRASARASSLASEPMQRERRLRAPRDEGGIADVDRLGQPPDAR